MSENNAIQRQKLLKRLLPALVILVGYFSFIGPRISASTARAEADLQQMKATFVANEARRTELNRQKRELLAELGELREKGGKTDQETVRQTGFLGLSDYAGKAIGRLGVLFARHNLRMVEDGRQDWSEAKDSIPATVNEIGEPVQSTAQERNAAAGAALWRVRFKGSYPDVYRMFDDLARDHVMIIPVSLDMVSPEGDGEIEWTVRIWI